jgi:two-component system cell cycle sensor histidine kinase/response regulator CckA
MSDSRGDEGTEEPSASAYGEQALRQPAPLAARADRRWVANVARIPRISGLVVLAVSAVVLIGWALDIRALQSLVPGLVTMKANTAIGLALSAAALLLRTRRPARALDVVLASVLAALVVALGGATIAEYAFRSDLHIDELVVRASADAMQTATPGRMALATAFGFLWIGASLLTIGVRTRWVERPAEWLAVATGALGLTALLGYVYGVIPVEGLGQGIQIAIHTALCLVALSVGVVAFDVDSGWTRTLLWPGAGGVLARRLLPVAFLTPLALSALRPLGTLMGMNAANGSATVAVATMLAFSVIIWRTSARLEETDRSWQVAEQGRLHLVVTAEAARHKVETERAARATAERALEAAERAVHEKDEALTVLDLVLDSTPVGFALLDRDLRYRRVNPALAAFNGLPVDALIGKTVREVMPGAANQIEPSFRQVLSTGVAVIDQERNGTSPTEPNKQRHWLSSNYPLRSKSGEIIGVGVTVIDETDRRRLEAQLRQSQKMEAVGQLAGGIAHDFNNLLTVIRSYGQLLAMELKSDEPLRHLAEEIDAAAVRAAALTRQLLAFSRQQVMQPRLVDLNTTVGGIEKMLQRLVMSDVVVETSLDPDVGAVHVDQGQLEQVLMNLATNARDAMPNGGRFIIATRNAVVDPQFPHRDAELEIPPGSYVVLSVSDTGVGMTPAVQAHIFEPFFTTKDPGKGTGLGLPMVYGIVRQSGGFVSCYSEVGRGTTFRIYLPQVDGAPESTAIPAATSRTGGRGEHILLVEDDDALRAATQYYLNRSGYVVTMTADGAEALRAMEESATPVDLVMTDVVMPGMNGRELAESLRTVYPTMRVLLTSGFTQDALLRRHALPDGMAFLEKPYSLEALAGALSRLLDGDVTRSNGKA